MKIMHVVPSMESGGVEQVVLELSQGFIQRGHETLVLSAGGRLVKALEGQGARHITLDIGKKRVRTLFKIAAVRRVLEAERPDVVHLHSRFPAWMVFMAWRGLPKAARPRLVTTVHGLYSVSVYSSVMCRGERVVAVSEAVRDYILKNYPAVEPSRITVIPNAVDAVYTPAFRPSEAWCQTVWKTLTGGRTDLFTLCLPGRITRIKGHLDLIPVLKALKAQGIPALAIVAGEAKRGKERYFKKIRNAFEEAGLSQEILWAGNRADIAEILSQCSVTLSLSLKPESFGKIVLEALALGRPVAGYAHGGIAELLERLYPVGCVPPRDTDRMASLLAAWYRTPPPPPPPVESPYRTADMVDAHLRLYSEQCL